MAGTYGINIILFHHCQIFAQFLFRYASSTHGTELMAVDAFEHDPFPVQHHDVFFHLEPAESGLLRNHFAQTAVRVEYLDRQIIQLRLFSAPQFRIFHIPSPCVFTF